MPERVLRRMELRLARPVCFVPFKSFYGGWLVYVLGGEVFRQWIGNQAARQLGLVFADGI